MFEASVYTTRRQALCAALRQSGHSIGRILLLANNESPANYADNCYRFRQDSSFLYCIGLAEPGLAALIDVGSGRTTLFADEQSLDMLVWAGPRPSAADLAAACGADTVRPLADLPRLMPGSRPVGDGVSAWTSNRPFKGSGPAEPLHYLPPYRADTTMHLAELLNIDTDEVARGASLPFIRAMVEVREVKEEREVVELERAVNTSIAMHRAVRAMVAPGLTEDQLMAEAVRVALAGGGMPSFPPIATVRGAILHNHGYGGRLEAGGLFLLDAGAETAMGYAGDLTSTMPISGRFDSRQKAAYSLVYQAGQVASAMLRPGLAFRDAHFAAAKVIFEGLRGLGLTRGDTEAALAAGAHALFFPHGLGHQMGLDVHDMEGLGEIHVGYLPGEERSTQFGLKSLRLTKPLRAGMVLTVEPGIYFITGLIERWKAERKHEEFINYDELSKWLDVGGYRNEDDWLVTADGARCLGEAFDKSPEAMES